MTTNDEGKTLKVLYIILGDLGNTASGSGFRSLLLYAYGNAHKAAFERELLLVEDDYGKEL